MGVKNIAFLFFSLCVVSCPVLADGNETIESFTEAKRHLNKIYTENPITFYCQAKFLKNGTIELPDGFVSPKFEKRSLKVEWEHIVPAENFGSSFAEWKEGHSLCVDKKGKFFKGRKCAEKVNKIFRLMQADMYNLVPAIGSVNAMRSNYNFTEFPVSGETTFGSCPVKITSKEIEPASYSKGSIARTYLYIESKYGAFKINDSMREMLHMWDTLYPVNEWECARISKIEKIQHNKNNVVLERCRILGYNF